MSTKVAKKVPVHKVLHPYIEQKRDVAGGKPMLRGTRIRVSLIPWQYKQGRTVDEILHSVKPPCCSAMM